MSRPSAAIPRPRLAVVVPVGPREDPGEVADTLDSIRCYAGADTAVVLLNDGARQAIRAVAARSGLRVDVLDVPGPGQGVTGGLTRLTCLGLRRAVRDPRVDVVLRLDSDALFIGTGLAEAARATFRAEPSLGLLGSYDRLSTGAPRDFGPAAFVLRHDLGSGRFRHPAWALTLRRTLAVARRNGYRDGEHVLAAAAVFSRECVLALLRARLLPPPAVAGSDLGDDQFLGLAVRAVGLRMGDLASGEGPLALAWRGLPDTPANLLAAGKAVVHSVKSDAGSGVPGPRSLFRARRDNEHHPAGAPAGEGDQPAVRVSILLAAQNAQRWLGRTLDSVLAQTLMDWRCWILDDGSTDGTLALARAYAARDQRFRVVAQANTGVSAARNRLLELTVHDGPFVSIMDSDDRWLPDALEIMTRALDGDPAAVGVQSLAEYIDEDDRPIRPGEHPLIQRRKLRVIGRRVVEVANGTGIGFAELVVSSGLYPPASMLFRRWAIEAAGRYDPSYRAQGDWELYLRMSRFGHFVELDRQTAWYRIRTANITGDRTQVAVYQARLRRKTWQQAAPGSADRHASEVASRFRNRGSARHHAIQARQALRRRCGGELFQNTALTLWFAAHTVAPRPLPPVIPLTRAVSRLQSRLWAAEADRGEHA